MKIRVQHEDGPIEILTIVPPVECKQGIKMDRLISADGMEFWFTEEGYYDGWGTSRMEGMADSEVHERIVQIEAEREVDDRN